MSKETQKQKAFFEKIQNYGIGTAYMLGLSTLGAHPANVVAATASKNGLNTLDAMRKVYQGQGYLPPNSWTNFYSGIQGHLGKEVVRSGIKFGALAYGMPYCEKTFSKGTAAFVFAIGVSSAEFLVNPFDLEKSRSAVGKPRLEWGIEKTRGSLGNAFRQFGVWYGWKASRVYIADPLFDRAGINKKSLLADVLASPIQAATSLFPYLIEGVVRSHQLEAKQPVHTPASMVRAGSEFKSSYLEVTKSIANRAVKSCAHTSKAAGGFGIAYVVAREMCKGYGAKFPGNTVSSFVANSTTTFVDMVAEQRKGTDVTQRGE